MSTVEREVADLWDENKEMKSAPAVSKLARRPETDEESASPPPVNRRPASPTRITRNDRPARQITSVLGVRPSQPPPTSRQPPATDRTSVVGELPLQSPPDSREPTATPNDTTPADGSVRRSQVTDVPSVNQSPVARPAVPEPDPPAEFAAERQRQELEEESIALARMLMEQEAVESYGALSADYLRYNAGQFSQEDLEALQAALVEDVEEVAEEQDLDYELMLRLGESIGDVKKDRWRMTAQAHIDKLAVFLFDPKAVQDKDENDSDVKCLVCQFPYEASDLLNRLPCGHCFHGECVAQWLKSNDVCPYCRQTILQDEERIPE